MWKKNNEFNVRFYTDLVEKHGEGVRALNWGSRESQEKRFEVLSSVGNLDGASILDVGCGMGHFYTWLTSHYSDFSYQGIDITPAMIELANEREPATEFKTMDLLDESKSVPNYDYVFASGIFVYHEDKPFDFMKAMITRMFELANSGVAFNSLSARADSKDEGEYYADPEEVVEFCKTLSPNVKLDHDYHPGDFSIFISRI